MNEKNEANARKLYDGKTLAEWKRLDDERREGVYRTIADKVGGELGEEIVAAIREFYSLMSPDVIDWVADLYDPEIGGFYYANSGRDTIGYGPDIESTGQALGIIEDTGVFDHVGHAFRCGTPDFMKEQIARFIKPLQDKNGFFYHPQWPKEFVNKYPSRLSRDLGWAVGLLKMGGYAPTYDTPSGVKGDGRLIDGTPVDSSRCEDSGIAREETKKEVNDGNVPAQLRTEESFRNYLAGLDLRNASYLYGNEVGSQIPQILYREQQLREENASWSLFPILEEWLRASQNPENGLWYWVDKDDPKYSIYNGVNGFLKTVGLYSTIGVPLPYAKEACQSIISAIYTDDVPLTVCYAYNAWFSANNIFSSIMKFSKSEEEGRAEVNRIRQALLQDAPTSIRKTAEKVKLFRKEDGSFSYLQNSSSCTSQWMPVSIPRINEGDVNATIICMGETAEHMFRALGLPMPPIFGRAEYYRFVERIKAHKPVVKTEHPDSEIKNHVWF